jgi:signal transduction histidine kinase
MPGDNPPDAGFGGHRFAGRLPAAGCHDDASRGGRALSRGRRLAGLLCGAATLTGLASLARAREVNPGMQSAAVFPVDTLEVIQLAMFAGVMGAALISAVWLIRERARIASENLELRVRIADLGASLQRSDALLNLKDQRIIVWTSERKKPELIGTLAGETGAPEERGAFFAFGRWLTPRSAAALEHAIAGLREKARAFDIVAETQSGALLEVQGRISAGHAIVRFLSLSPAHRAHMRLKADHQELLSEHANIRGLIEALDMPFWSRGADGRLQWVNRAYAAAVEAQSPEHAVREGREFLGTPARQGIAQHHLARPIFAQTLSTVIGGDRRQFGVTDYAGAAGSAGIAIDLSQVEALRAEHERMVRNHAETLDQLTTAVAMFGADQKLRFFNQAFQKLWGFDPAFLNSAPDNTILLDRLRSDGKLAEQPEWRKWKEHLLAAYRSADSQEHWWHLPDGRTLRVIANPNPKGGVTWIFENLTEKLDLESRYNIALKVHRETLDNLAEGVAVFGPDGRVRLSNPAFARLWHLDSGLAAPGAHISAIRGACASITQDQPWEAFVAAVTGFDDERHERHGHVELNSGAILSFAVIPLPNGQVMITFVDVTDSVNFERALRDKNDALQKADQLKNDFVQHVSYELRSPLTNIIGFTELLGLPDTGPLNSRQRDYVDHIGSSSSVLLTIVNDILDLATVDAGIMQLDISDVRIEETVRTAAELIAERLREHAITLELDISRAPRFFQADEHRLRQILFNLLANAANYAPEGSAITLSCEAAGQEVAFSVHDDGPGIAPEVLDAVFRRFEPRANGGRRRGAGLGLSIVKSFVELHGGSVIIDIAAGRGTTVICRFPVVAARVSAAAE